MDAPADREAAFDAFVRANESQLQRLALALTGDRGAAQDLVQTSLMRVFSHWSRIWDQEPLAYTRRAIVNASHDRWRRQHEREVVGEPAPQASEDPASAIADRNAIVRALQQLTAREREVIVYRYLLDLSETETARELGLRPGTVKSTTHRATAKLRASGHLSDAARATT